MREDSSGEPITLDDMVRAWVEQNGGARTKEEASKLLFMLSVFCWNWAMELSEKHALMIDADTEKAEFEGIMRGFHSLPEPNKRVN